MHLETNGSITYMTILFTCNKTSSPKDCTKCSLSQRSAIIAYNGKAVKLYYINRIIPDTHTEDDLSQRSNLDRDDRQSSCTKLQNSAWVADDL